MRRAIPYLGMTLLLATGCDSLEPTAPEFGQQFAIGPSDPPVVTIYDINFVEIDALTVNASEAFTLIGAAVGNNPLYYHWLQTADGNTVAIVDGVQYLVDYMIADPGDYVLTLSVIDVNGYEGSDEVSVTVLPVEAPPGVDELIEDMILTIESSDPSAWRSFGRKVVAIRQLEEVHTLISEGSLTEAYSKMVHDIKPKLTGLKTDAGETPWGNGVLNSPWVLDPGLQETLRLACNAVLNGILELAA